MPAPFTLGAFAVIFNEQGQVLMCHRRDRDAWNLPGGAVERREMMNEAVVRETKEETGLEVVVDRFVGVYGKADRDDLVFVFLCRVVAGRLTTTDESDELAFFDPINLPSNTLARSWQVQRIQDALAGTSPPVFRQQVRTENPRL